MITTKRAYEPSGSTDGYRVLIDRLWPRGLSKARAQLDVWGKDVAPSRELRVWYASRAADISDVAVLEKLINGRLRRTRAHTAVR